jgi:3-keto steroid reductase
MLRHDASIYDRYPYVSHLVCNAGVAPFLRISWPLFLQQLWQDTCQLKPFEFAAHPRFNIQRSAIMSDDGLGWVWQCNVFGHYIIVRSSFAICMLTLIP